ncbi:unnamed protein product [Lampetra fluviatilis]
MADDAMVVDYEDDEEEDETAELLLSHFAARPVLDFGCRLPRDRLSLRLRLRNPSACSVTAAAAVTNAAAAVGFSVEPREVVVEVRGGEGWLEAV